MVDLSTTRPPHVRHLLQPPSGRHVPAGANTHFDQFWSVRQQPRQCGHVSISEHFKHWQSLGMDMSGLLRESMIVVEALNGSGTVDFASATVQVD